MGKMEILMFAILALLLGGILLYRPADAQCAPAHKDEVQWIPMEATKYCYGTTTASGKKVRPGIAAAREEWIGLTAAVYMDEVKEDGTHGPGEFIGYFEIEDTGSNEKIQNGTCIDIYDPDLESCVQWGRRDVWVVLRKGVG